MRVNITWRCCYEEQESSTFSTTVDKYIYSDLNWMTEQTFFLLLSLFENELHKSSEIKNMPITNNKRVLSIYINDSILQQLQTSFRVISYFT